MASTKTEKQDKKYTIRGPDLKYFQRFTPEGEIEWTDKISMALLMNKTTVEKVEKRYIRMKKNKVVCCGEYDDGKTITRDFIGCTHSPRPIDMTGQ